MDTRDQGCTVPPEGWWCSRGPGHDGPCAARPAAAIASRNDLYLLREGHLFGALMAMWLDYIIGLWAAAIYVVVVLALWVWSMVRLDVVEEP